MLLEKVENYTSSLLEKLNDLPFHNIHHTRAVISHVKEICDRLSVSAKDGESVLIAAWFHDVGYITSHKNHEEISSRMAEDFLVKEGLYIEQIEVIKNCILSTRLPQKPKLLNEKILCDADLYHLSSLDYFFWQQLLRREWEICYAKKYSDLNWHKLNREFLSNHSYHTEYGKKILLPRVKDNLAKTERLLHTYQIKLRSV
ncbi:HD domain-containing protein [Chondrinema litorale]|uniref:HD domain-containing protein n=1 Tax=Chondrinema litorale TaxID=2994555 RepID=UPI002543D6B9|nr:HD domain-containing protein [Chondrinema litorale]UZR99860.1 HD domain-containing protein [Chondrinema litorale]